MRNWIFGAGVLLASIIPASLASSTTKCRCTPKDSCWPSVSEWNSLNASVSGKLILNTPPAAPCYPGSDQNAAECASVHAQWTNSTFQSLQPIGFDYPLDNSCPPVPAGQTAGTCTLGQAPVYTVNATEPEDVAAGIVFARKNNIRLVVRNTGHDILGKNEGYGSLQVWMKYIQKGILYHDQYVASDQCTKSNWTGQAFTIGGGYVWRDVYAEAFSRNLIVVGGGDPSVGCIGGYMQGGGHSPASRNYGLAADNVLEAQVVLANGTIVTANACQNTDLFFAIRGGGGGSYGVVTSTVVKAYPSESVAAHSLAIAPLAGDIEALLDAVADVYGAYPALNDAGYSGYGTWSIASATPLVGNSTAGLVHVLAMIGQSQEAAQTALEPLLQKLQKYNGTSLSVTVSWFDFPTYGAYYQALSGVQQPVGSANSALASRMLDQSGLTGNPQLLRDVIGIIAGSPDQFTSNSVEIVGGGQVFTDGSDPNSSVNPGWRTSYLNNIVGRGWADGSNSSTINAVKIDVTIVKTGAMRLLSPFTGSYMNEADRNDPLWSADFYGAHFNRLTQIKNNYDPDSVFYCHTCVGSQYWVEDFLPGQDYGPLCSI